MKRAFSCCWHFCATSKGRQETLKLFYSKLCLHAWATFENSLMSSKSQNVDGRGVSIRTTILNDILKRCILFLGSGHPIVTQVRLHFYERTMRLGDNFSSSSLQQNLWQLIFLETNWNVLFKSHGCYWAIKISTFKFNYMGALCIRSAQRKRLMTLLA